MLTWHCRGRSAAEQPRDEQHAGALQGRRCTYMPAAARQRRAWPPRDVATWPPTARRRSVPRSAVGRPKSSAGATSVLRRRAWRTPTAASSSGREGGRSRHRRLGGRASDLPATARQRAGSGGARPRPTGRVPTDALGRGPRALRRTRIGEANIGFRATALSDFR